jgi:hypothetical protein
MVSGGVPFRGDTQTDVVVEILSKPLPTIKNLSTAIPADLVRIIDRALAKDAEDRYPTVGELLADLKDIKSRLDFESHQGQIAGAALPELPDAQDDVVTKTMSTAGQTAPTRPFPAHATNPGAAARGLRRFLMPALITLIVAAGVVGGYMWMYRSADPASTALQPVAANRTRTLAYSLTVQSYSEGRYKDPFTLSGEMLFRNRDRIRLNIQSQQTGHLYILNQGPDTDGLKQFNILFPTPTTNSGSATLAANQKIQIPRQSWFELDTKEGTEQVVLVWSEDLLPELEAAKRFANAEDKGRIKDAELNAGIDLLLQKYQSNKANVERDDGKKESRISGNASVVMHTIKLEHH